MGPAPPKAVKLWYEAVKSMGPDELDSFGRRTFATWDRASFGDLAGRFSSGGGSSCDDDAGHAPCSGVVRTRGA